jgi:YfiH family protein
VIEAQPTSSTELKGFHFESLAQAGVVHGVTGRQGGVSREPFESLNLSVKTGDDPDSVQQNRRRVEEVIGPGRFRVVIGRLTHGSEVTIFKQGSLMPPLSPPAVGDWSMFESDAAISDVPGVVMLMTFADCVPILLLDIEHQACGLAHAGWRGTAGRISSKTVAAMAGAFGTDPAAVQAAIGPSIGSCCYTVGRDVREAVCDGYGELGEGFFEDDRLDLWRANVADLQSIGVLSENITVSGICTRLHSYHFFSHRGDGGQTGRFGAWIGLTAAAEEPA